MALENFRRHELKYLITLEQYSELKEIMLEFANPDKYFKSIISNIYYDTPNYLLIRRSIEKPKYKEKLRIRSYGIKNIEDEVYIELKKKYDGIVYKRRIKMPYKEALMFLSSNSDSNVQVLKELRYFTRFYKQLSPKVMLSYSRESYYAKSDEMLRITIDKEILWRDYEIDLTKGCYGTNILPTGYLLLEIKTINGYPLWLNEFLSKNKIYKTSFSKYGNVYKKIIDREKEEKKICC